MGKRMRKRGRRDRAGREGRWPTQRKEIQILRESEIRVIFARATNRAISLDVRTPSEHKISVLVGLN